jgi:hypothetical protein
MLTQAAPIRFAAPVINATLANPISNYSALVTLEISFFLIR